MEGFSQFAVRDLILQALSTLAPAGRRRFGRGSGPVSPLDECQAAMEREPVERAQAGQFGRTGMCVLNFLVRRHDAFEILRNGRLI